MNVLSNVMCGNLASLQMIMCYVWTAEETKSLLKHLKSKILNSGRTRFLLESDKLSDAVLTNTASVAKTNALHLLGGLFRLCQELHSLFN